MQEAIQLQAGVNTLTVPITAGSEGFHRLTARVHQAASTSLPTRAAFVAKPRGSVLLYEDRTGEALAVSKLLQQAGLTTETRPSATVPTSAAPLRAFDAIVLVNVAATSLTLDQQRTLRSFVKDLGKGVVIIGGPNSFALGDYGSSQLEPMLPVHSDLPPKPEQGTFGLVIVIDRSGSMDLRVDGTSRLQMAKEGARLSLNELRDDDYVGLLAEDTDNRWIFEPQLVSDNRGVPAKEARIYGLAATGGDDFYTAIAKAFTALQTTPSRYKHIVLFCDQDLQGDPRYDQLLQSMHAARVTLSIVAIGPGDTAAMKALAVGSGGRYYYTEQVRDIPKLLAKDTSIAIRSTTGTGPVQPQLVVPSPILRGLVPANLPALQTFDVTTPRDEAQTILASPSGDPLLAAWQYGTGRTVAFTGSLQDGWAGDWGAWHDGDVFWGQAVRYAMGTPFEPGLSIQAAAEAEQVKVQVDSIAGDGSFINLADVRVVDVAPSGKATEYRIRQDAPGHYSTTYTVDEGGAHELRVRLSRPGQPDLQDTIGVVTVADPEVRSLFPNTRLLRGLSGSTGGRQISAPQDAFADGPAPSGQAWQPFWDRLLALALILLPIEVAFRRLGAFRLPRV
jgi:uncharacterized membrane protein